MYSLHHARRRVDLRATGIDLDAVSCPPFGPLRFGDANEAFTVTEPYTTPSLVAWPLWRRSYAICNAPSLVSRGSQLRTRLRRIPHHAPPLPPRPRPRLLYRRHRHEHQCMLQPLALDQHRLQPQPLAHRSITAPPPEPSVVMPRRRSRSCLRTTSWATAYSVTASAGSSTPTTRRRLTPPRPTLEASRRTIPSSSTRTEAGRSCRAT